MSFPTKCTSSGSCRDSYIFKIKSRNIFTERFELKAMDWNTHECHHLTTYDVPSHWSWKELSGRPWPVARSNYDKLKPELHSCGNRHPNVIWMVSDSYVRHGKSSESFLRNGICANDWLVLTRLSSLLSASSRSSASPQGFGSWLVPISIMSSSWLQLYIQL